MSKSPLISIILPVHNGSRYLKEAIESCINQTYRNIELIIVDDGSKDDSLQIAEKYKQSDERVKIIPNKENLSLPVSLNIGHKEARGDLITWTSDDNLYQKDAIATLYTTIMQQEADVVYSDYLLIGEDGKLIGRTILKPLEFLLFSGEIGACFLYRREVFERNCGYNEKLFLVEDHDFWLRALKHSHFYKIENPGYYYYRYHSNSLTERMKNDSELKNKFLQNLEKLYEGLIEGLPLKNKEALIQFLISRFINGANENVTPITNRDFFPDLEIVSHYLKDFSGKKLKRYIIDDVVEAILQNKKYQKPINIYNLHKAAKKDLIHLPIDRYFAVLKKCLI